MEDKIKDSVCAVVVTYNRKELLIECLEALRKQTRPIQAIYLIDNASTDGTPQTLLKKGYIKELPPKELRDPLEKEFEIKNLTDGQAIKLYYIRMHENTGGAGGFYEGVKRGYKRGYDWLWLMDDDTIPMENSLYYLIKKAQNYNDIGFICSKVLWNQNIPNYMNVPFITQLISGKTFNYYDNDDILLVKSCSFVSVLIPLSVIEKVGLPIKEFFIWYDDVEYTSRITHNGYLGVYCRESKVFHRTKSYLGSDQTKNIKRQIIGYRNRFYTYKRENFLKFLWIVIYEILKNVYKMDFFYLSVVIIAFLKSLFFRPKINFVSKNSL